MWCRFQCWATRFLLWALLSLGRGGKAPWSDVCRNCCWWLRAAASNRLCVLDMLESSWAEGEPDEATERMSIVGNISHLATLIGV